MHRLQLAELGVLFHNMGTHFYVPIFPHEALIASQLDPADFGSYMSIGSGNGGSYERIIFIEIDADCSPYFDWDYARTHCVPHANGEPKHSVWISTYRVLEHVPVSAMKSLSLVTADGRTLTIEQSQAVDASADRDYYVYLELCPLHPLVTSRLSPARFAEYMTDESNKISVPTVAFADLKTIDFRNPEKTGNIGRMYDRNIEHLKDCVAAVTDAGNKVNKNVERSVVEGFSYSIIHTGIYVGNADACVVYPMPSVETLRQHHYD
ncbi:MAG: hypothetical protein ACOC4F_03580, partial [bacterium]